jgi:thioesterase domain-containing protein/acyl carrier protein
VHYSFGFGRCRSVLSAGGEIYLPPEGFNPVEIVDLLAAGEINAISAVPTLWRLVLGQASLFEPVGERVRWIEIGSQFMSGPEKARLRGLFPNARIVQHYGLTEASRTTFLEIHEVDEEHLGSVGRALAGVEVQVDERSIIRIRGPHLASGVLRDGQVRPLVDEDGWFTTSDQGHLAEGFLHFRGRADDIINCGGVKLSPDWLERRVEARLSSHGAIGVSRVADELRGEGVLVAIRRSAELDRAHVREAAVEVLESAGVSAAGVVHLLDVDDFPTTDTGKLRRRELQRAFEASEHVDASPRPPYDPPRDEVERFLAGQFERVFGIERAGLADSVLAGGADSLRTVELVAAIDAELGVELPLAALLRDPTLLGIADAVRWKRAGRESEALDYVVPLAVGQGARPKLFIVGGSYGNVLHLHDLAQGMADLADVYGIQYRGLLNDDQPRETLPETAADFVGEVLSVQPDGPYLLGGYSGGGLIALEMARQLLDRGHEVGMLAMIDTRLPARPPYQAPFSWLARQRIRMIDARRRGQGPADLVLRALRKASRIVLRRPAAARRPDLEEGLSPTKRRSERIHLAYLRAVAAYEVPTLPMRLHYFRPADERTYSVGGGTIDFVDSEAHRVNGRENGWAAYFEDVEVRSTPGGHYTLAHAPNAEHLARVMGGAIRELL